MRLDHFMILTAGIALSGCASTDQELVPQYTHADGNYKKIAECVNYNAQNAMSQDPGVITLASTDDPPQARVAESMRGTMSMLVWSLILKPGSSETTNMEFRGYNSLLGGSSGWWKRLLPTLKRCAPTVQPLSSSPQG